MLFPYWVLFLEGGVHFSKKEEIKDINIPSNLREIMKLSEFEISHYPIFYVINSY